MMQHPAVVIPMAVVRLACTSCGAEANASCNCGKPYVPAMARAAKAIAENPQKSDRAIAKEIGVSNVTVSKARKEATVNGLTVDAPRTGLDGKARKQAVNPRGLTQKRRLGIFERIIEGACRACDRTESALNEKEFMPARLTDEQRAEATRQLTESISYLQRALKLVAQMERAS
jgi:hypothetical protein